MATNQYIGRRESVGFSVEATPGTAVTATDWARHLSFDFQRAQEQIQNESAMGRVEKVNEMAIVSQWAEGNFEGKIGDTTIGYLLYSIFGTLVTSDNADANAAVKDHTFDTAQTNNRKTLTVTVKNPLTDRQHTLVTVDEFELTSETAQFAKVNAVLKARKGSTVSSTVAVTVENEFIPKHVTVKFASSVASLGAASAIEAKSVKLKISSPTEAFTPLGASEPTNFLAGPWEATGELVLQYTATTYEDIWYANTAQAMSITLANTDVVIGTAAHPTLAFTAPQARLNSFSKSNDLDTVVEQTIGFYCELSPTDGYALRAMLTNIKSGY
jgi:hypothetical protein